MLKAVMIGEFLRSPSETQYLLEFVWPLSEISSCVMLYIPRARDGMYLVEPV